MLTGGNGFETGNTYEMLMRLYGDDDDGSGTKAEAEWKEVPRKPRSGGTKSSATGGGSSVGGVGGLPQRGFVEVDISDNKSSKKDSYEHRCMRIPVGSDEGVHGELRPHLEAMRRSLGSRAPPACSANVYWLAIDHEIRKEQTDQLRSVLHVASANEMDAIWRDGERGAKRTKRVSSRDNLEGQAEGLHVGAAFQAVAPPSHASRSKTNGHTHLHGCSRMHADARTYAAMYAMYAMYADMHALVPPSCHACAYVCVCQTGLAFIPSGLPMQSGGIFMIPGLQPGSAVELCPGLLNGALRNT
eukprot:352926-Chlamydomonas_euryale.AAC.8